MALKISDVLNRTVGYCWKKEMNCVFFSVSTPGDKEGVCLRFEGMPIKDAPCRYRPYIPKNAKFGVFV